jgi:hypothetical protein
MVKVKLLYSTRYGEVGETVSLDEREAQTLVNAGAARPATKPDAGKLGVDPATAVTSE